MDTEFINLDSGNIASEHLCCIIRTQKAHPGVEAKRAWLAARLDEGHVFRKVNAKGCAFIEYAPLETAWAPVVGDNYLLYIYCLWVLGDLKGHGYGRQLMEYCIADAKARGKSGVCMLGADKQKAWLSDQKFAQKYGFTCVDHTADGYQLLALSLDGSVPRFAENAKSQRIDEQELTVYYDDQCPFIPQRVDKLRAYCEDVYKRQDHHLRGHEQPHARAGVPGSGRSGLRRAQGCGRRGRHRHAGAHSGLSLIHI